MPYPPPLSPGEHPVRRLRIAARFAGFFWLILSLLSCSGTGDYHPLPGDEDYIPPGWNDPPLAYEKAAYFPAEVIVSAPAAIRAPGQYANSADYGLPGNAEKLLGPPSGGGTIAPDHGSIVSLGMAGGSVTVRFDPPIDNHPDNIGGYDFIVFGNSCWYGGDPEHVWREPGVIWVMEDENSNDEADDTWYLIAGSHHAQGELSGLIYSSTDTDLPPPAEKKSSWWPELVSSPLEISDVFLLPDALYGAAGENEPCWGYCDVTPTLRLGDLSGADGTADDSVSDVEDYPGIDPVYFYTVPDTHGDGQIDAGSGGGDAIKLEWAVDALTMEPVPLERVSWIKIASGSLLVGVLGEYSCEVDAIARVRRSE